MDEKFKNQDATAPIYLFDLAERHTVTITADYNS